MLKNCIDSSNRKSIILNEKTSLAAKTKSLILTVMLWDLYQFTIMFINVYAWGYQLGQSSLNGSKLSCN